MKSYFTTNVPFGVARQRQFASDVVARASLPAMTRLAWEKNRCGRGLSHSAWTVGAMLLTAFLVKGADVPTTDAASNPETPARVLLVTGIDYPGHRWRETTPVLRAQLEQGGNLNVTVVEDPWFLDSAALARFDAILLHFQNWQVPGPGPRARQNLQEFVRKGGGLVVTHFACGAWYGEWPEFKDLAGRAWFGPDGGRQHDPHGAFVVRVTDRRHPITVGLNDFETVDELYTCHEGDAPIQVLATAQSKVDGEEYPMAFVLEHGSGRVFHCSLGHNADAYRVPAVGELLRRGTAWAAGKSPRYDSTNN